MSTQIQYLSDRLDEIGAEIDAILDLEVDDSQLDDKAAEKRLNDLYNDYNEVLNALALLRQER